jgi:hypothetical protein
MAIEGSVLFCGRESADGMESVPGAVATGSQLTHDPGSRSRDPVATAPGTDLILKLRHHSIEKLSAKETCFSDSL